MESDARIFLPVRSGAWMTGRLGQELREQLEAALGPQPEVRITAMPRGFLVEAPEAAGPLLEAVHAAARDMDAAVAVAYPIFHKEIGPVWSGTLQAIFPDA